MTAETISATSYDSSPEASAAWSALLPRIHPVDQQVAPTWRHHYEAKFEIARRLCPATICEIGVRAGYSAFMFLRACPEAFLLGIEGDQDAHGGVCGIYGYARRLLKDSNFALLLYDSQKLARLPQQFDLVHIDGDHSYPGTLHDLHLGWQAGSTLLVDDYGSISTVRAAVEDFCSQQGVRFDEIDDKQVLISRADVCSYLSLSVDGKSMSAGADFSIRFVEYPDRPATPVLYSRGRRVITSWALEISHTQSADPWGCSG